MAAGAEVAFTRKPKTTVTFAQCEFKKNVVRLIYYSQTLDKRKPRYDHVHLFCAVSLIFRYAVMLWI